MACENELALLNTAMANLQVAAGALLQAQVTLANAQALMTSATNNFNTAQLNVVGAQNAYNNCMAGQGGGGSGGRSGTRSGAGTAADSPVAFASTPTVVGSPSPTSPTKGKSRGRTTT